MSGRGKRYSRNFGDELAARVRDGRMPASLAPDYGPSAEAIRNRVWWRRWKAGGARRLRWISGPPDHLPDGGRRAATLPGKPAQPHRG